jgi:large repetitive protein
MKAISLLVLMLILLFAGCSKNDEPVKVDCAKTDLAITLKAKKNPTGCNTTDGEVSVNITGGTAPYTTSLNGGSGQSVTDFLKLMANTYIVKVKDASACEKTLSVTLSVTSSLDGTVSAIIQNNQCNPPNGSATVTGTGGVAPYTYLLGTGSFSNNNIFTNLKEGNYTVRKRCC